MAKETRIQFRVSEEKKNRFSQCAKAVKLKDTALGEAAVEALCDYIEANGEITLPLAVIPQSVLKKLEAIRRESEAQKKADTTQEFPAPHQAQPDAPAVPSSSTIPGLPILSPPGAIILNETATPRTPRTRAVMREIAKQQPPQP